jgi:NAD+ diphosphatase
MVSERVAFTPGISSTATEGRLYVIAGQSLCVTCEASGGEPRIPTGPVPRSAVFLGELADAPCFAHLLGDGEPAPEGTDPIALRQLFGALPDDDFAIAGRALGVTAWDRDHRCCGRCGSPTERSATERVRTCTRCGHGAYPRISPAVIALIERDGRALLARNARFPRPFFSTLAGFVELGESLEAAVAREIHEEAGISITDIRYFGSQPWPFTSSLMIGFTARWAGGEIIPEPSEIADADWFAPDELPTIPPKLSIARELIDDFVRRHGGTPRD